MAISNDPAPGEGIEEPSEGAGDGAGAPDPAGGGCLKLGWGCLPVIAALLVLPASAYLF